MQALERILAILEAIGRNDGMTSATRIADKAGLSQSTCARLLADLMEEQAIVRTDMGEYRIGPRIAQIARSGMDSHRMHARAQPILDELRDLMGETVSLQIRAGAQRVCIAAAPSRHPVSRVIAVGATNPLVGTATGEVLLSRTSWTAIQPLVVEKSAHERKRLQERLELIRDRGWSLASNSVVQGATGVAAAVIDLDGAVVAAVSCSGPTQRFTPEIATGHVGRILEAAGQLSAQQSNGA